MITGLQSAIWLMRLFVTDSTVCLLPLELLTGLDRDWRAVGDFMCQDERHLKQTVIILAHLNVKLDHFFKKWPCIHIKHYSSGSPWFIEHVTDVSLTYADFLESFSIRRCGNANIWIK